MSDRDVEDADTAAEGHARAAVEGVTSSETDDLGRAALTTAIGRPAHRALTERGLVRLEQLTDLSERDLLALHGVGPRAVRILRDELAARGMALRDG